MTIFNPLSAIGQDLRAALPRWGLSAEADLTLLSHSENTTYLASEGERSLVLRVHRCGYHTADEIRSELAWISALIAEQVVATPRPLPARDGALLHALPLGGTTRHVVAFERMSGRAPAPEDSLVDWFGTLGAITARLHAQCRRWTRPAGFRRKNWDFDAMLGDRPLWGDWRAGPGHAPEGRALLQRVSDALARELGTYGMAAERFGLIHADLRLANLLVDGDRLGVIDFDDCGLCWFLYDFAAAISFMEHDPIVPDLQEAWLAGYRTVAPIAAADEAMLPVFVMVRRMLLTAWIASHAETETAQALGQPYAEGTLALGEHFLARR